MTVTEYVNELDAHYRELGVPVPGELRSMIEGGKIGMEGHSVLEPYHLCAVKEISLLKSRWPKLKEEMLPFVRDQRQDTIICFSPASERIFEVHYQLNNPSFYSLDAEYDSIADWLAAAQKESAEWKRITG